MEGRQKQLIESYQRALAFLNAYPAPAPVSYSEPKAILEDVVARLTGHSSNQETGHRMSRQELKQLDALMRKLREHHLRPIAAIAKASAAEYPGLGDAAKLPSPQVGFTRLIAAAEGIRSVAAMNEARFVQLGRPTDFLQQLDAAIAAVRAQTEGYSVTVGRKVGSKLGMAAELKRGRLAIGMLDSIVAIAFEGQPEVLGAWRLAKRVRALPGGGTVAPNVVVPAAAGTSAA